MDFEDAMVEEDTDADVYIVRRFDVEATPDKLRMAVEESLDTLSCYSRKTNLAS